MIVDRVEAATMFMRRASWLRWLGSDDLVVVQTTDALLITTRERSQDVGKVVAELKRLAVKI